MARICGQSPRHVWKHDKFASSGDGSKPVDKCQRCGAYFSYSGMDTHGPMFCNPRPEWLREHPEDDLKTR